MTTTDKPTVLIVGAGLGGLVLGALLERCDVPYTIFERASVVKPLGSAISVAAPTLPLFEQIGIFDQCDIQGKAFTDSGVYGQGQGKLQTIDYSPIKEFTGYKQYIISRPVLYDLILQKVPPSKILFKKRVQSISEENDKVSITTTDDCTYDGDILVGADGAYSTVRKSLYEILKRKGVLPKSDQEDLPFSCTCLVGQTTELDPKDFPSIAEELCQFNNTVGKDKSYSWTIFTTAQNTICWAVVRQLDQVSSKATEEQRFQNSENSEWGPDSAQSMCDETRSLPLPVDGGNWTLGDLYDRTPKDMISKVMLEEKVFETWYSGRTVLLGDACHKLHPSGGHGAVTAMHDAVALANLIYALPNNSSEEITKAFSEYQAERLPFVMESFKSSQMLAKSAEKGIAGAIATFLSRNIPQWLWDVLWKSMVKNRPQCGAIEQIPCRGALPAVVSPSTEKARAVFEKRKGAQVV